MTDSPLCINCVHFLGRISRCMRPIGQGFSRVSGPYPITVSANAADERERSTSGLLRRTEHCGPDGRFFEPKPTNPRRRKR
jgi:hypothetical protein